MMRLSLSETMIFAMPEGVFSSTVIPEVSTPFSSKFLIISEPHASSPTLPIMDTSAPSLAAATAWLAPLPPNSVSKSVPATVSPAFATWSVTVIMSILILPTIVILGLLIRLTVRNKYVLEDIPESFSIHTCCEFDIFRLTGRFQQIDDGHAICRFAFCLDCYVDIFKRKHLRIDQIHRGTCIVYRTARKTEMILVCFSKEYEQFFYKYSDFIINFCNSVDDFSVCYDLMRHIQSEH